MKCFSSCVEDEESPLGSGSQVTESNRSLRGRISDQSELSLRCRQGDVDHRKQAVYCLWKVGK